MPFAASTRTQVHAEATRNAVVRTRVPAEDTHRRICSCSWFSTGTCAHSAMRCSMAWMVGVSAGCRKVPQLVRMSSNFEPPVSGSTTWQQCRAGVSAAGREKDGLRATRLGAFQPRPRGVLDVLALRLRQETVEQERAAVRHGKRSECQRRRAPAAGCGSGRHAAGRRTHSPRAAGAHLHGPSHAPRVPRDGLYPALNAVVKLGGRRSERARSEPAGEREQGAPCARHARHLICVSHCTGASYSGSTRAQQPVSLQAEPASERAVSARCVPPAASAAARPPRLRLACACACRASRRARRARRCRTS